MILPRLQMERLEGSYSICRFGPDEVIDLSAVNGFVSLARTGQEVSIVCRSSELPHTERREDGWSLLRVEGPIDFGEIGILARIAGALAAAGISLFAISTFDTDYVLVRETRLNESFRALRETGIEVIE